MSDYTNDIKALLDYLHGSLSADLRWAKAIRKIVAERDALAAEVADLKERLDTAWGDNAANDRITDHLRAEVARLTAERDEARRLFCKLHAGVEAVGYAEGRGWDCFEKEAKP
jgi:chorismate mutase